MLTLACWSGGGHAFSSALFEALFTTSVAQLTTQHNWPSHQAQCFGNEDTLDHHYACQRIDQLTHKAAFTLHRRSKLKLCGVRASEIRVGASPVAWHALVSNCQIALNPQAATGAVCLYLVDGEASPIHLALDGRRLDVAQLGRPNQWCYVVSCAELQFSFAGTEPGLFVLCSQGARCDLALREAFLEFWASEPVRPLRYSVDNARMLYRVQALARGLPCDNALHETLGPLRVGARYQDPRSGFADDMERFVLLVQLQAHFNECDAVPLFFMHDRQLPVTLGSDAKTLTVYDDEGLALADVWFERESAVLRFRLMYAEERRYVDWTRSYVYTDDCCW